MIPAFGTRISGTLVKMVALEIFIRGWLVQIMDKSIFVERLTEMGVSFDTRYPDPRIIGFQRGNGIKLPIPGDIGNIARVLAMVLRLYESATALWIWRRSGSWVPNQRDLHCYGGIIRGLEKLGLPLAQGAVLCETSDRPVLPAVLLLWVTIQWCVDDDIFLVAGSNFPVTWIDHDGDFFLDCAKDKAASELNGTFCKLAAEKVELERVTSVDSKVGQKTAGSRRVKGCHVSDAAFMGLRPENSPRGM